MTSFDVCDAFFLTAQSFFRFDRRLFDTLPA
jgi:hypothetical protein